MGGLLPISGKGVTSNLMLSSVFPASWKISEVVPLPKDGDLELANNNRPVSLLPAMSKICEQAALNEFIAHMKSKKRLTEHQSGNRAQHSTETLRRYDDRQVSESDE